MYKFIILYTLFSFKIFSQQIPQYRGPFRNGHFPEKNLLSEWPKDGPKILWTQNDIGKGFSSVTVSNDIAYIIGIRDTMEILFALQSLTGKVLWQTQIGSGWQGTYPESRCTPTIEDERIYCISGDGNIVCINSNNGNIKWSLNGVKKFHSRHGYFGIAESPLIVNNKLIYTPCGDSTTMVALNKYNGETIWKSAPLNQTGVYVSPILIEDNDKKLIVTLTAYYVIGFSPENGKIQWKYRFWDESWMTERSRAANHSNTPLYKNGCIYVTSGYGRGGVMLQLSDNWESVSEKWKDSVIDTHFGGVVLVDGFIYGSTWIHNRQGNWACIAWDTGQLQLEKEWYNKGSIIYADSMLYCFEEKSGNLGLVNANPKKLNVKSSFKIDFGSGPYFAHPAIYNRTLYIRHGKMLRAYNIEKKMLVKVNK